MQVDMAKQENDLDEVFYHEFTDEELELMLYYDEEDEAFSEPIHEYIYIKEEWKKNSVDGNKDNETARNEKEKLNFLKNSAVDTGERTVVDLKKDAPTDEELEYLDLDSEKAHVVTFYSPWCPHCKHFKFEYIDIAREFKRRTVETQVEFHAVSCALYRSLCRAYEINGFPFVYGWPVHSPAWEDEGIELNPPAGPKMSPDTIAQALGVTLAHETKDLKLIAFNSSKDERRHRVHLSNMAKDAAKKKTKWHHSPSNINERYHNAAVSLAFVLKTSIFLAEQEELNDLRTLALTDFLDLVDWATPHPWHIRTGMVRRIRESVSAIRKGRRVLESIVEDFQSVSVDGGLWGSLLLPEKQTGTRPQRMFSLGGDVPHYFGNATTKAHPIAKANIKWTYSCTHGERGMGFTCGLWDLFHIISIGATMPNHLIYGFRSGYLTSPRDVAEIVKRFIVSFFPCDVCRFNFKDMYNSCGRNHCERLVGDMPALIFDAEEHAEEHAESTEVDLTTAISESLSSRKELAMWVWEVHNSVNERLMRESAERENRNVTAKEIIAAKWPTRKMCRKCWLDKDMEKWREEEVMRFLKRWYWPAEEKSLMDHVVSGRRLLAEDLKNTHQSIQTSSSLALFPVGLLVAFIGVATMMFLQRKKRDISIHRKDL